MLNRIRPASCRHPALVLTSLVFLLVVPVLSQAATYDIHSETLVRILERDTASEQDALVVPAYEYLRFDIGDPYESSLTFHFNGWGRVDATDNDFFDDQNAGELLYAYFEYRPEEKNMTARLGRQAVFAGVAGESIDGLFIEAAVSETTSYSLYAGQPVSLDSTNGRDGDSIYGGRLAVRLAARHDIGLSYKLIENDSNDAEEMAGLDLGLALGGLYINGLSSYNLITEDFAEHSYDMLFSAAEMDWRLFYSLFTFEDYFGTDANNANPFRILAQSSEELSSYGLEITRMTSESFEAGFKFARHDYDLDDASNYGAVLANWYGDGRTTFGGELGYSEGDNGRNDMYLARAFAYLEMDDNALLDQVSADFVYALYDRDIFSEDTSIFVSLAGSRNLTENLLFKLSADYENNPYFDSDVRGLVSLTYRYANQ